MKTATFVAEAAEQGLQALREPTGPEESPGTQSDYLPESSFRLWDQALQMRTRSANAHALFRRSHVD